MSDDTNRFDLTAKLERIDTFTTKNNKEIVTLIFKIEGQWPKWIPIKVFGHLAGRSNEWKPGDVLEVKGRLSGREWSGKVYADNEATSIEVVSKSERQQPLPTGAAPDKPLDDDGGSVPF